MRVLFQKWRKMFAMDLNVCVCPQFTYNNIAGGNFGKKLDCEGEAFMKVINALMKGALKSSFALFLLLSLYFL
jgi:hypothetical protein